MKKSVWLVPLTLSLSACSFLFGEEGLFPSEQERYDEAPELRQIVVPPALTAKPLEPDYPIPEVEGALVVESTYSIPRPTPLTAAAAYDAVRIQRLGDDSWALVSVPPGQLWPQVRAFLSASGIGVASTNAEAGLIDTQFVKLEGRELGTRFRFRVDSGIQRNTAELHVLQQNRAPDDAAWPLTSDDLELEGEMLKNVAQFIANSSESAPVSMMADRAMGDQGRIAMEETDTSAQLRLDLPFNRAWASTNKGLEDAGFTIDDRNRSEGVYYVTYIGVEDEEGGGWFSWMFSDEEEDPMLGRSFQVLMTEETPTLVRLRIVDGEGAELPRRDQVGLLTLLQGNIN